jgi:hypothetical protein
MHSPLWLLLHYHIIVDAITPFDGAHCFVPHPDCQFGLVPLVRLVKLEWPYCSRLISLTRILHLACSLCSPSTTTTLPLRIELASCPCFVTGPPCISCITYILYHLTHIWREKELMHHPMHSASAVWGDALMHCHKRLYSDALCHVSVSCIIWNTRHALHSSAIWDDAELMHHPMHSASAVWGDALP